MLTAKPTGNIPIGRPRGRREDVVRIYGKEIGFNARNWADSLQGRGYWKALMNVALNLGFHKPWS